MTWDIAAGATGEDFLSMFNAANGGALLGPSEGPSGKGPSESDGPVISSSDDVGDVVREGDEDCGEPLRILDSASTVAGRTNGGA